MSDQLTINVPLRWYWTLDEALPMIRAIQPHLRRHGYHVCLGGGVLNNGESQKDLDLYFLPMDGHTNSSTDLIAFLTQLWGEPDPLGGDYPEDQFKKLKFSFGGLRIDVFILDTDEEVVVVGQEEGGPDGEDQN